MMKKNYQHLLLLLIALFFAFNAEGQDKALRLIFIRHAEKSKDGDNLNCQGFNRSVMLPIVIIRKFGIPDQVYIPSVKAADATKHLRMLQTVTPFAVKYDLHLNSNFDVNDFSGIARSLIKEQGTVLIVWEHQGIPIILKKIGMKGLNWPSNDFDSIWVVTFSKGKAKLFIDNERLKPAQGCPF